SSNNLSIAQLASEAALEIESRKLRDQPRIEKAASAPPVEALPSAYASPVGDRPVAPRNLPPAKFLKGKLIAVDCSQPPGAILTVVAGTHTWKMSARDREHTIVIGSDGLSCAWQNQRVAVNYRETSEGAGELISVELQ